MIIKLLEHMAQPRYFLGTLYLAFAGASGATGAPGGAIGGPMSPPAAAPSARQAQKSPLNMLKRCHGN